MPGRPNIVYVFTDQQFAGAMSCAGNPDLATPAIDGIAAQGVRFANAYCTNPLCTPSRASMFTGAMPHEIGITGNGVAIPGDRATPELGHIMSRNGYRCVYGGKWHVPGMDIDDAHGFEKLCGISDWELPDKCAAFIASRHDKPFFLVASFDNPHNICEFSRKQSLPWGKIDVPPAADCPNLPQNHMPGPYEPQALRAERKRNPVCFVGGSFTPDEWRQYIYAYYRMVEMVDRGIGKIIAALRDAGLDENTVVIFSSDHGDGLAAHQWNQKWALYEESVRVPLIIRHPQYRNSNVVDKSLVSSGLDLYPTICDFTGIDRPAKLRGRSLRPALEGKDLRPSDTHDEAVFCETFFEHGLGTSGLMVRTEKYKYCAYSWGRYREQLFDMENDAGETVNLAVNSRHSEILQKHRALLAEWIADTDYRVKAHYAHGGRIPPRVPGQGYEDGNG